MGPGRRSAWPVRAEPGRERPRLVGVALLPIQDISEAVKELRRAVNDLGMVGAVLPAVAPGGRLYSGPEFYPLWEEAQKLDQLVFPDQQAAPPAGRLQAVGIGRPARASKMGAVTTPAGRCGSKMGAENTNGLAT